MVDERFLSSPQNIEHEPTAARFPAGIRIQPRCIEAEQALLGAILINNEAYSRVSDYLQA